MTKAKSRKKHARRYGITPEDFVRIWRDAKTVDEVVQKTKMPRNSIYGRVTAYRKKGIKLTKKKRQVGALDVNKLNKLLDEKGE